MMWLSTIVVSRYFSAAMEAFKKSWSNSLELILPEVDQHVMTMPGRNGRCFGSRKLQHRLPQLASSASGAGLRNPQPRRSQRIVRTARYSSLAALSEKMVQIDSDPTLRRPTVVLVLEANFSGQLMRIIQRRTWGCSLVLVAENGRVPLPGEMTLADLAVREAALGWGQIVFERDLEMAFSGALQSLDEDQPLVILWPDWLTDALPLHLISQPHCVVTPLASDC